MIKIKNRGGEEDFQDGGFLITRKKILFQRNVSMDFLLI